MKIYILVLTAVLFLLQCSNSVKKNYIVRSSISADSTSAVVQIIDTEDNSIKSQEVPIKQLPYTPQIHQKKYTEFSREIDSAISKNSKITNLIEKNNTQNLKYNISIVSEVLFNDMYSINVLLYNRSTDTTTSPNLAVTKPTFYIGCLYEKNNDTMIYINSYPILNETFYTCSLRNLFDSSGNYLYYFEDNVTKRYDVSSCKIENLKYEKTPIFPLNNSNIFIYSYTKDTLYLLDKNLDLISSMETDKLSPISAICLGGNRYMMSSMKVYPSSKSRSMEIYIFDFDTNEKSLITETDFGFLIDAVEK